MLQQEVSDGERWLPGDSREHICLGYERREQEDAKNKLSALLFCLGLVQMLGMSSWVKQNPCPLDSRRGDLG